ncbi:hypothetical protein [Candidatus Palauibacter sp.]|uniref:hypothetical protein n=1 Tax=Candidatus Palauibacter sp. TaxID=3101350 RepID=UPI003B012072
MKDSGSLPILVEDRSRVDWCNAVYEADVQVEPTRATVTHNLRHAPTLERLVEIGQAKWATELRCPKTLLSRVEEGVETRQVVEWSGDSVDGDMFVIPGLLAVQDLRLRPSAGELISIWDDSAFEVRRGWWLARGSARRTKTLGQSLLRFRLAKKLDDGQMRIERDQSEEDLCFHVHLAEDIWPDRFVRHVQMAALIGALGQLGTTLGDREDDEQEPRIADDIRQKLERAGVPTWDDPTTYDPAWAATVIEPFRRGEQQATAYDD